MLGAQHTRRLRVLRTIFGHQEEETTNPYWAWVPPSLLYDGCWFSFPGDKQPGDDIDHQPLSSTKDKERVELYLYPCLVLHGLLQGGLYLYPF